jgi:hypothetical protein
MTELSMFVTACYGYECYVEEGEARKMQNTKEKSEKIVLMLVRKVKKNKYMEEWMEEDVS